MQKFISAEILEVTQTHYVVELTVRTKKLFRKPVDSKVKMFREKRFDVWRYLGTGSWECGGISDSLNAFVSTGKQTINF